MRFRVGRGRVLGVALSAALLGLPTVALAAGSVSTTFTGTNFTYPGVVAPPSLQALAAQSVEVMDAADGQVLYAVNPEQPIAPASLVKMMTFDLAMRAIAQGKATPSTMVTISQAAKNMSATPGTSEMYLGNSTQASFGDLLKGLMVSSGNDAAIAIADDLAGGQAAFVAQMNAEAKLLGMDHTTFVDPHGLGSGNVSTAGDMAILARHIMQTYPSYATYTALPSFSFGTPQITAVNYNTLIGKDAAVNGMKSGYIDSAHLVATASQNGMQIIAVVMGVTVPNVSISAQESDALAQAGTDDQELLDWAFSNFHDVQVSWAKVLPTSTRVWEGRAQAVAVTATVQSTLTLPGGGASSSPRVSVALVNPVVAPVTAGEQIGTITLRQGTQVEATFPLVAKVAVARGNFLHVLWDKFRLHLKRWI